MRIAIICTSEDHPIYPHLRAWAHAKSQQHEVELVKHSSDLDPRGGELLFLISYHEILSRDIRERYRTCLVIHASDLPEGRGWSPLVWQILEGSNTITVTLFEAGDELDCGPVWHKQQIHFEGHDLADEIYAALFAAEMELMDYAVENFGCVQPVFQSGTPSYYRRRTPEVNRLDIHSSIAQQFNLLRCAEEQRYPAFSII